GCRSCYRPRMIAEQLTHEQVDRLTNQIGQHLRYLNRLCKRMDRTHWPVDDPLRRRAIDARNAMQALYVEVMTGTGDVGPPNHRTFRACLAVSASPRPSPNVAGDPQKILLVTIPMCYDAERFR